jgi:hypothetical protein
MLIYDRHELLDCISRALTQSKRNLNGCLTQQCCTLQVRDSTRANSPEQVTRHITSHSRSILFGILSDRGLMTRFWCKAVTFTTSVICCIPSDEGLSLCLVENVGLCHTYIYVQIYKYVPEIQYI